MDPVARRLTSPTFVGRSGELGVLGSALERAAAGRPAFAFVGGESGVGKTRLLREFETRARAAGAHVLIGQCLELAGEQIPYAPVVGALRPLARDGTSLADTLPAGTRNALAELLPELGGTAAGGAREEEEHGVRQGRLFEALLTLMERLGRDAPVVLLIEDLHWADGSTRDFITFLVRSAREEALCVVLTYRSDELHRRHPLRPLLAELERAAGVERVGLERFDRGEVAEQLAGILQAPPPGDLTERLFTRSQGNPLYIEELLAASGDGEEWLLPDSLRDALLSRIERLTRAAQEVIGVAAVLDRPMPHPLLEAISELPPAELMAGAREAVAHQVLVTDADGRYAFRHALVGEAVHGDLLPGEDTALHGRIAAALDARPQLLGDDVGPETVAAELACHWRAAHDLGRALESGVRAGLAAARIYAFAEAQRQFERALELWPRVPDAAQRAGRDRAEVLALAADCADARGETSRSAALIRDALADVDEQRDPLRAAALYERLGWYLRRSAASEESLAALERARGLLPEEPTVERARLLETHARQLMLLGDFRPAVAMTERAIADAEATGSEITAARALMTLGFARAGLGDEVEGVEILRRAHDRTMAIGSPSDRSRAAINLSELLDLSGHTAEALAVVRAELEDSQRRPERSAYDVFMVVQEVNFLIRLGRLDEARERMPARVPGEAVSYTAMFWRDQRARLALLTGDLPALREELAEVERLHQRSAEPQWIEPRADLTAELALREDRFADARAALRRAAPLVERSDEATRLIRMAWAALRVEAEVAGRARALGEDYVPELDAVAERLLARGEGRPRFDEACAWAALARAEQGRRATLLGTAPPDPVAWQDAAAAFDALSLPVPAAYARFRAGEALVTLGDRAAAAVPLRAARAAGAALITADVAALARRARIELEAPAAAVPPEPDGSPAARLGLTPRELEVLLLVAEGRTNRSIGETLFMSEKTASVHVSRILAKLGVGGRVEAAAVAHRLGLGAEAAS